VSFRGRLLLFFTIIVIVPMIAVALVLFGITADSETGKADSRIAEGMRVAFTVYRDDSAQARRELRRVAGDRALADALAESDRAELRRRLRGLRSRDRRLVALAVYDNGGVMLAQAGSATAVAFSTGAPVTPGGRRLGTLAVSLTTAADYARRVRRLTGFEARLFRDGRLIASTIPEPSGSAARSGDVEIRGRDYRGRVEPVREAAGPPVAVGVFEGSGGLADSISESRLVIGGILLAFLALALASSVFVVRALQGQIDQFLAAAKRLARGDFSKPVPTEGNDEFAALGIEFNKMSAELAGKIREIESKRRELEETIRRVGDAFASGLDRRGLVELAVKTAVGACSADGGRAIPIDPRKMHPVQVGDAGNRLKKALEAAERAAFRIRVEDASELIAGLESSERDAFLQRRSPAHATAAGVFALSVPLRARLDEASAVQFVGVISIARTGIDFTPEERDLFAYLAGQAAVSIENANLHETVQRQAVTDELTGLCNLRHFHETLDSEIERSRRYSSEVGLAMLDIDDFKLVNDTYGHQQGDIVLLEVGRVLRELSRDIDEPARYGGEEMAVILPQTDLAGAELLAERMRRAIESLAIQRLDGRGELLVTASFGVASLPQSATDKSSLIAAADVALYQAKRSGKNRVERAATAPAPS
jgi:diguanylate cyclase (GGDEF)-like protein